MKLLHSNQTNRAFTLIELLVVIAVFAILLGLIDWGVPPSQKRKAQRIACVSNLKEMGMAFRLWENDHGNQYPMSVSVTNGGAMELIAPGKAYVLWQTVSNRLASPRTLWCPADTKTAPATSFSTGFSDTNISYFVNLAAAETYPQMIMLGDDNLLVDGQPVQPGILNLWTNTTIAWTKDRHGKAGNIGMADGSVMQVNTSGLTNVLIQTATATNRWLIP
jgi:prepilin-type N-terminal cleavage/methylation domain-containing protein/prepilin-type processing-associated H-X9-DG protein